MGKLFPTIYVRARQINLVLHEVSSQKLHEW